MVGATHYVLTCSPAAEAVAPCPAGMAPIVTSAYLLDASAQRQVDAAFAPVDYAAAAVFWPYAFSCVIVVWVTALLFRNPFRR